MGERPIGFAHRGAPRFKSEDNTLPAFKRALMLGARGLESDIGLTADGIPVLVHQPLAIRRSARISQLRMTDLPSGIPTLDGLYGTCGANFDLAIDMGVPNAIETVVRIAREHRAETRLWLTYWKLDTMRAWRERWPDVRLVYSSLTLTRAGTERTAQQLHEAGVDALNMHYLACRQQVRQVTSECGLRLFAWGIRSRRPLERVIALPVDGMVCDDVSAMVDVLGLSQTGETSQ